MEYMPRWLTSGRGTRRAKEARVAFGTAIAEQLRQKDPGFRRGHLVVEGVRGSRARRHLTSGGTGLLPAWNAVSSVWAWMP